MKKYMKKTKKRDIDKEIQSLLASLEKIKISEIKNIDISKPLYTDTFAIQNLSNFRILIRTIRKLVVSSFRLAYRKGSSGIVLLDYDYERVDHNAAWSRFQELFPDSSFIEVLQLNKFSFKHIHSLAEIVESVRLWTLFFQKLCGIKPLVYRMYFASDMVVLYQVCNKLSGYHFDEKVFACYFDGGFYENIIVQMLRKQGIKTITLQHGQPVFHGFAKDYINQAMILNFSSDYIIVPGEFSKKQFLKGNIPETSILMLGSLRKRKVPERKSLNKFTVFCDGPTFPNAFETNIMLIKYSIHLSEKLGLDFDIKLHPFDNLKKYLSIYKGRGHFIEPNMDIGDVLEHSAFALLHASGVYIDILAAGVKAFCYENDFHFPIVDIPLDSFRDEKDLMEKIVLWFSMGNTEKVNYIIERQKYYLGAENAAERNRNFVQTLV